MIVNPDGMWMSIIARKWKHHWKPKEHEISKCKLKGVRFLHLPCQEGRLVARPRSVTSLKMIWY